MERRHTPGPWHWTDDGNGNKYGRNRLEPYVVSGTVEGMVDVDDNDAALIAAAPELLAVAKRLDAWWTESFPEGPDGSPVWAGGLGNLSEDTLEIWRAFRAAIAKAEGRA